MKLKTLMRRVGAHQDNMRFAQRRRRKVSPAKAIQWLQTIDEDDRDYLEAQALLRYIRRLEGFYNSVAGAVGREDDASSKDAEIDFPPNDPESQT